MKLRYWNYHQLLCVQGFFSYLSGWGCGLFRNTASSQEEWGLQSFLYKSWDATAWQIEQWNVLMSCCSFVASGCSQLWCHSETSEKLPNLLPSLLPLILPFFLPFFLTLPHSLFFLSFLSLPLFSAFFILSDNIQEICTEFYIRDIWSLKQGNRHPRSHVHTCWHLL